MTCGVYQKTNVKEGIQNEEKSFMCGVGGNDDI